MFKQLIRRWTAWKIETGRLPHGRTSSLTSSSVGQRNPEPGAGSAVLTAHTDLVARHIRGETEIGRRQVRDRKFTTAGRDALIDAFTNTFEPETFNYHDCGTGTGAESNTDTALGNPVSEARVAGTQSQPTSDTYRTVATFTFSNTYAITEHGIFSQASKPGGILLDRTVFSAINVVSGDKIEFTFSLSIAAEA